MNATLLIEATGQIRHVSGAPRLACMTTDRLPRYRVLTGPDDASFCYRVSEALDLGYELYGSPAMTVNDGTTIVAQALLWPGGDPPPPRTT